MTGSIKGYRITGLLLRSFGFIMAYREQGLKALQYRVRELQVYRV